MSDMQQLEAMGYRFRLEGEAVRYSVLGEPPPGAEALLRRLDREQVRAVLRDRARGYTTLSPEEAEVPWEPASVKAVWRMAFTIYEQHTTRLQAQEDAAAVFQDAAQACARLYSIGSPLAKGLALAVYEALDQAYHEGGYTACQNRN